MTSTQPRVPIPKNGVDYRGKIVLAPMVRSGELPSRLMALKYGADLVWGPETVDRSLIGSATRTNPRNKCIEFTRVASNGGRIIDTSDNPKENVIYRIHPSEIPSLIFQLGTASPDLAVKAATLVAPHVSGIDVNAGCPKPFSTSGGMGAALLSTPNLLCDILRALVKEVGEKFEIGISVKIRLLATEEETKTLVEKLCQTGVTGLTIHCRTRSMRKTEKAIRDQLKMVGDVCRAAGVACLMNGDVETREQAETLVKDFGVDGAMIATAAEKNPSVFRAKEDGGVADWQETIPAYLDYAIDVENRWGNTKFLIAQMTPGKEQVRIGATQAKNYENLVEKFGFEDWTPASQTTETETASALPMDPSKTLKSRATALDAILGITDRLTKAEQKDLKRKAQDEHNAAQKNGARSGQGQGKKAKKRERKIAQLAAMGETEGVTELIRDGALIDVEDGGDKGQDDVLTNAEKGGNRHDVNNGKCEKTSLGATDASRADYITDLHEDMVTPAVRV